MHALRRMFAQPTRNNSRDREAWGVVYIKKIELCRWSLDLTIKGPSIMVNELLSFIPCMCDFSFLVVVLWKISLFFSNWVVFYASIRKLCEIVIQLSNLFQNLYTSKRWWIVVTYLLFTWQSTRTWQSLISAVVNKFGVDSFSFLDFCAETTNFNLLWQMLFYDWSSFWVLLMNVHGLVGWNC